jgi:hypothetical protein
LSSTDEISDGNVIGDDSLVCVRLSCVKFDLYVFLILFEFFASMRESEDDGFRCASPGWGPISWVPDFSLCLTCVESKMCFSKASLPIFIDLSADDWREEMVQVEGFPPEYPLPLGGRDTFGRIEGSADKEFGPGEVFAI